MTYYCPNCGKAIDSNIFFHVTGQCQCSYCGTIIDLLNAAKTPPDLDYDKENNNDNEDCY